MIVLYTVPGTNTIVAEPAITVSLDAFDTNKTIITRKDKYPIIVPTKNIISVDCKQSA